MRNLIPVFLCLTLTGCFSASRKRPYVQISTTAISAAADTKTAYDMVETQYYSEQADELAEHFADQGYTPGQVSTLLSIQGMRSRMEAVDIIAHYGEAIQGIVSVRTASSAAKTTPMGSSSTSKVKVPFTSRVLTQQEINLLAQGITALGQLTESVEGRRRLPKLIKKADPSIQTVCSLLIKDIGQPDGLGLRGELKASYDSRLMLQNQFIKDNWDELDGLQRRAEIEKLPALEKEQKEADDALVKVTTELSNIASMSHNLAEKVK